MDDQQGAGTALTDLARQQMATDQARIAAELLGLLNNTDPFVSVVRATHMPMIITNPRLPDNPVVFANDAFCRLSGYDRAEIVGRNCRFLQGAETDPGIRTRIRAAVAAMQPLEIDIRNHRKDGTPFWNRLMMLPVCDAAGELAFFVASQVDVTIERERLAGLESSNAALLVELTDRLRMQQEAAARLHAANEANRRAQEALLAKAAEFEVLAENVSQLAWMAEPDGRITWYNRRWYTYTGTDFAAMQGRGWHAVHHPDDIERIVADAPGRWAAGLAWQSVYRLRSAAGEYRSFLTAVEPIRNEAGALLRWFGTNTDITAQLEAERQLRELNETLEQRVVEAVAERAHAESLLRQSQKMEAVGQLTGGLAHDFNNLLTGIFGSLELLQTRVAQGRFAEVDRYVGAAQEAARRAAALTHRLLAFSRRQTLEPRATDINHLVAGMAELIGRTTGPAVTVETISSPGLWPTLVDQSQLENALLNLCINARDAMPDGGRLVVETANVELDAGAATERELPPGQYVALSVSDDGTGMPPDVIARAFDPFFTTKPIGQGTGLGLSMTYGFVKQSGGQVRILSTPGEGTTIHLLLPRLPAQAAAAP